MVDSYVQCRVNPGMGMKSQGIPDGSNTNYVVVDHFTIDTIEQNTTRPWVIQTLTSLPMLACVTPYGSTTNTNDISVNGTTYGSNSENVSGTGQLAGVYPLSVPTPYSAAPIAGAYYQDPYRSTTARMVAVAYKLKYTGQPIAAQGTYTVTPNTWAYNVEGVASGGSLSAVGTEVSVTHPDDQTNLTAVRGGVSILSVDGTNDLTAFTVDSKNCRLDHDLWILPRHHSDNFKMVPTRPYTYPVVFQDTNVTDSSQENLFSGRSTGDVNCSGVIWYDNDWANFQIVVSGAAAGSTFTWETFACFEYTLGSSSVYTPLAIKQSPTNKAAITVANKLVNSVPTGTQPAPINMPR